MRKSGLSITLFLILFALVSSCDPVPEEIISSDDRQPGFTQSVEDEDFSTSTPDPKTDWPPVVGPQPSTRVAAFYYPWYNSREVDGHWDHWGWNPPEDIASDYYPLLGPYSNSDPLVLAQHFAWMRESGIGLVISSWWGRWGYTDQALPKILNVADHYGIKVAFHIEPYSGRSADRLVSDVHYLVNTYGDHPAFFWTTESSLYNAGDQQKGLFLLWATVTPDGDSAPVAPDYWKTALDTLHADDPGAILITDQNDPVWVEESHFDGAYNYGVLDADQTGYRWAMGLPAGTWYLPGINPGFSARRIGYEDWVDTPRNAGETYRDRWEQMFALGIEPTMVVITTFNEWHEGTQIEPAISGKTRPGAFPYLDYEGLEPKAYLDLTKDWAEIFHAYQWPESERLKLVFRTTSDWTDLYLVSGAVWLRPALVSTSGDPSTAGLFDGHIALGQPLELAELGREVEAVFELQIQEGEKNIPLIFMVERGGLGASWVELYREEGEEWVLADSFWWAGWNPGDRNTARFEIDKELLFVGED